MSDAIRISLATTEGSQSGTVARLGEDDLSFVLEQPLRGQRTIAFSLSSDRASNLVWGTLKIVGEAAAPYGRRVRANIMTINADHRSRLRRWVDGDDDDSVTEVIEISVTTPTHARPDSGSITNMLLGSDAFSPLSDRTPANEEPHPFPPGGRKAIGAAMRHGINADRWSNRGAPQRSHRIRVALGASIEAISHDMPPVPDEVLQAEWED